MFVVQSTSAATFVWDGGTGGSGTDLGVSANWSPDGIPAGSTSDIIRWNGTAAGVLSLTYATQQTGIGASPGLSIDVTAAQTSALTVDGTTVGGFRVNSAGVSIASGAGAFTLGNGVGTFNMTLINGTLAMNNNSANTATLAPDVTPATTSAGVTTWAFGGTGNWFIGCNLNSGNNSSQNIVTKSGAGTLTLTNVNTYNGTTTITGGTLALATGGTIGSATSALTVNGGVVDLNGFTRTNGIVTFTSGALSNGTQQASTFTANNAVDMTVPARLVGTAALTKSAAGTLTLNSATANTYSGGTTIGSANTTTIVRAAATQALGAGTISILGNNGDQRLELIGGISLNNAISLSAKTLATQRGIQNISGDNTLSGPIALQSGGSDYGIRSDAGTLTLSAATAITGGSLTGPRNLRFQGVGNILVSGAIVNGTAAVSVNKADAGTVTLSGVNTYTGATTISAGTLTLSGSGSIANTPQISVASGAILDVSGLSSTFTLGAGQALTNGTGSVNGNVATSASTAAIYPASIGVVGSLTFNNNLNMSSGGAAYFDVSTTYNTGNDQIVVGGNLTLSSSDIIHINALSSAANLDTTGDYILFAVSGTTTIASQPSLVWDGTPPANNANYAVTTSGNNVVLRYSSATAPTVLADANPASPTRNQPVLITATVTPGSSNIASVVVDASAIGGSPTTSLVLSNGVIYTNTVTVSSTTTTGAKTLTVIASDNSVPAPLTGGYNLGLTVVVGNKTWDGGALADDNWTSNANWQSDIAPALIGDSVTFAGTTRLTPSLDANHSVTGFTFDNTAGAFVIGTAASTLTNGSGGIVNNSTSPQTLNVPMVLNGAQTINAALGNLIFNSSINNSGATLTVSGAANTDVAGSISGSGGLTKTGNGTLTLTATNGFTGSLFGKGGAVVLDSGKINTGGNYCSIGVDTGDNATLTLKGSGTFTNSNDFNVGDIGSSVGTLNISNSASLKVGGMYVASANAAASTASGTVNQSGGSVVNTFLVIGGRGAGSTNGVGVYNLSGGTLTSSGALRAGGFGTGALNISEAGAASFAATTESYVGYRSGTGTVSMVSGSLSVAGELRVGGSDANGATMDAVGTVTVSNATVNLGALTLARGNYLDNSCAGTITLQSGGTLVNTNDVIVQYAGTGLGKLVLDGGNLVVGPTAGKWLQVGTWDTGAGRVDITNGNLSLWNGSSIKMCMQNNTGGNVFNQAGGNVTFYSDAGATVGGAGHLDLNYNQQNSASSTSTYNLSGGTLTVPQIIATKTTGTSTFNFNGGTLKPTASSTTFLQGLTAANVQSGGAVIDTDGKNITINQALLNGGGGGGLTKNGNGTLALNGVNTFTGLTTVNAGTLGGTGSLAGGLSVGVGGTLAAGNSIGTFTVNGAATLGGNVIAEVTNSPSADLINFAGGATLGGTLTVVANGMLTNGQTFNLFDGALSGTFATLNLPGGLSHWNTANLNSSGEITFVNNAPTAANFDLGVAVGGTTTAAVLGKFAPALDADSEAVTIIAVSPPSRGTATITGGNITYSNTTAAASDSFTYTVSDGLSTTTATVTVTISSPEGFNKLSGPALVGAGPNYSISYLGIPNEDYALDETASLTPPITWTAVMTNTASGTGSIDFIFVPANPTGFFRTRHVP